MSGGIEGFDSVVGAEGHTLLSRNIQGPDEGFMVLQKAAVHMQSPKLMAKGTGHITTYLDLVSSFNMGSIRASFVFR
jgi:hypothetical protein